MTDVHTLTRHRDIQNWVIDHKGMPAIARVRNRFGELQSQLRLRFERPDRHKPDLNSQDDGMSPCSWTAWLAELDRQQLALKVSDTGAEHAELVKRRQTN